MAEFDRSGFSAIDHFFGGSENDGSKKDTKISQPLLLKGKRRGVGSVAPAPSNRDQNDITKKVLNVGRKRGRMDNHNRDDSENEEDHSDKGDDDGEEAGRTSIAPKLKPKLDPLAGSNTSSGKSKKKSDKKERQKKQQDQGSGMVKDEDDTKRRKANEGNREESTMGGGTVAIADAQPVLKKHKRRKIRSRQKNIRKDNRENKPDHLVVGQRHYQGRPITAETRVRLNLPAPKPRTHFISEPSQNEESIAEEGGLAIDDLLAEGTEKDIDTADIPEPTKPKKNNKKSKKSKYKNLKV